MIDKNKRYLKNRDNDHKALGNYIQWHIESNKIKKRTVSDHLGVLPTTLNNYFKQKSFQFSILWRISLAVKHNFLMELGEQLNIPYQTKAEAALKAQLLEKEKEMERLKTQLEVYEQMRKM